MKRRDLRHHRVGQVGLRPLRAGGRKVVKINEALEDSPELVNESPYGDGWMVEIELGGDDFEAMLDCAAYAELVAKES